MEKILLPRFKEGRVERKLLGWRRVIGLLFQNRLSAAGFILTLVVVILALLAPFLTPYDPLEMNVIDRLKGPSLKHPLGTDNFGRDILSRVLYGARISLRIGILVALFTGVLGTVIGLLSGYFKKLDSILMRLMDALMAFPSILLAIGLMAALGPNEINAIIALGIVYTPRCARVVRGSVLSIKETPYIEASRALGANSRRILTRHILPNALSPLIVQATFIFAYAILAEASLSFVGVGTPPPTPSWGNILSDGRVYMRQAPWITVFPGLAIATTVLGLNLSGDGLRDILDPRMRYFGQSS